ncbi:cryptochrome/photolyase family protein [Seonamhaeicola sp. ML3]|uniref:cryptochrome/photolyase family protein n=1 Tax=Seonamhaeicola sp. ML3 TaxID=2937786 RepID=UPI00200E51C8|nr:cryptochrome/photolyase family protein [Seonamhaeicola sp. ML3]
MKTTDVHIIFPNQLFKTSKALESATDIVMVEEFLFFKHYKFHKQKIAFHRASMKSYQDYLKLKNKKVHYIDSQKAISDIRLLLPYLASQGYKTVHIIDPVDCWLEKRIINYAQNVNIVWYDNPGFINSKEALSDFFKPTKKKFFQTAFYKNQRKKLNILMNQGEPEGGKWTFDTDNRKRYPKDKTPPNIHFPDKTKYHIEAEGYVSKHFANNYGALNDFITYPLDFDSSEAWLDQFFEQRFYEFGIYEDAIVKEAHFLNHSILSPLVNVGLLDPEHVARKAVQFAKKNDIPINSTEGFVRQIIGWREFIRGVYQIKGSQERTTNFWGFTRKIPKSFYTGTTGIAPIDDVIKKVLKTGYAHHIERLMVLGNFMVLCEFNPNEVYQWFMELFIDSYDWVMVPNVYGMSLYADGGIMSTKPYISSSNYIMKMSNYKKGEWQKTWDGLFWTFMDKHRSFFLSNPRLGMLIRTFDKMPVETKEAHFENADFFLKALNND